MKVIPPPPNPCNQFTLELGENLQQHDMKAMVKCCQTLNFLVRDTAHITPHNFALCVRCIRTFADASIKGGIWSFCYKCSPSKILYWTIFIHDFFFAVNKAHLEQLEETNQQGKTNKDKTLKKTKERDIKRQTNTNNIERLQNITT